MIRLSDMCCGSRRYCSNSILNYAHHCRCCGLHQASRASAITPQTIIAQRGSLCGRELCFSPGHASFRPIFPLFSFHCFCFPAIYIRCVKWSAIIWPLRSRPQPTYRLPRQKPGFKKSSPGLQRLGAALTWSRQQPRRGLRKLRRSRPAWRRGPGASRTSCSSTSQRCSSSSRIPALSSSTSSKRSRSAFRFFPGIPLTDSCMTFSSVGLIITDILSCSSASPPCSCSSPTIAPSSSTSSRRSRIAFAPYSCITVPRLSAIFAADSHICTFARV